MIRPALAAAAVLAGLWGPASACPDPAELPELIFHSCRTPLAASALLLPDEPLPATADPGLWVVTGVYTGTDRRAEGGPNPVGLFIHAGQVVNRNLARMDGILLLGPDPGSLALHHSEAVPWGGRLYDLTDPDARAAFAGAARKGGASVLQSHLLIIERTLDVRPRDDAPRFVRRILFTDADGFGLWQSRWPQTLHHAAQQLALDLAPRMALNLDMGSFDYCWQITGARYTRCGFLARTDTEKLSNLLLFHEVAD